MSTSTVAGISVRFRYNGTQHRVTVGSQRKAESVRLVVENTLTDLRLCRLSIPPGVDVAEFIASGGRAVPPRQSASLADLTPGWRAQRVAASTTRLTDRIHCGHLTRHYGIQEVGRLDYQSYVDSRAASVGPGTIRKELLTLSSLLKYAKTRGIAVQPIDIASLKLPAVRQERRFTTLSRATDGRLVLLNREEVQELRRTIRERASGLIADSVDFVAFTGARRSEVCRVQSQDVDLQARSVTIRELKKIHGTMSFRTVPLHPDLLPVLERRASNSVVFTRSVHTLTDGFRQAIEGTKFDVKGFGLHVLRHSAASRLLAKNVPPVTVAAILGQTVQDH